MSELIVVGFKGDKYRAAEAMNQLKDLNDTLAIDLTDAVAVFRDSDGKLRFDQSYQLTPKEGGIRGALFGGLIGALVTAPFTAGASVAGAVAASTLTGLTGGAFGATLGALDAETWKEDHGIAEDFVHRVGALLQPNDSAVFVLVRTADPDAIGEAFKGYGGTVLRATVSERERTRIEQTLHASR